jgi:DNA-binding NarL/FixJ family response regulator
MLSMFEDEDLVVAAMRAGARGYVVKEASEREILQAVLTVAGGGAILGAGVADKLQQLLRPAVSAAQFPTLTARECDILNEIARGRSNAEIAARFSLSDKTVRNNVSSLLTKIQVVDRSQAIVRAREAGLGESR